MSAAGAFAIGIYLALSVVCIISLLSIVLNQSFRQTCRDIADAIRGWWEG